MKTAQSIFNKTYRYFVLRKMPQARARDGSCCYRGPKSNCAVGCQLPNFLYNSQLEGQTIFGLFKHQKISQYFGPENFDLLRSLQMAHDGLSASSFSKQIEEKLRKVAQKFELKIPKK